MRYEIQWGIYPCFRPKKTTVQVYHFLSADHGLDDLRHRRLRISRIIELNDPFEFLGVDLSDRTFRQAFWETKRQLSKTNGLLCFSKTWRNPVLWGHYADKHRGLCLGFDVPKALLEKIKYVKLRLPVPNTIDEAFMKHLLFTKFLYWQHEQEYRVFVNLEEEIDGSYFVNFSATVRLRAVIVGAQSTVTRADVAGTLDDVEAKVDGVQGAGGLPVI